MIVFLKDEEECRVWKDKLFGSSLQVEVFAGDNAGNLVALLEQFRLVSQGIILTTSAVCKGADFVFAVPQAFVIHTDLPNSWL